LAIGQWRSPAPKISVHRTTDDHTGDKLIQSEHRALAASGREWPTLPNKTEEEIAGSSAGGNPRLPSRGFLIVDLGFKGGTIHEALADFEHLAFISDFKRIGRATVPIATRRLFTAHRLHSWQYGTASKRS
jgi:hypothetical protein